MLNPKRKKTVLERVRHDILRFLGTITETYKEVLGGTKVEIEAGNKEFMRLMETF